MNKEEALAALDMIKYHHNQVSEPALIGYINIIRAALTQQPETQWQPIETAPEDGAPFLIWCEQQGCVENKKRHLVTRIKDNMFEGLMFYDEPTHWTPLLKPPADI